MSYGTLQGKSQAAMIYAQAMVSHSVAHNPNTLIGVASESLYKRLIEIGIPEANLVKMWENSGTSFDRVWYDELKF